MPLPNVSTVPHPADETLDCLVIGGGAAGLTAAMYLGRYRRRVLVIDDGKSRLWMIPMSRNVLGFPDGIAGTDLLDRLRDHATRFDVQQVQGRVDRLERDGEGFVAHAGDQVFRARKVILATGACDIAPEIEDLQDSLKAGNVRFCPVCDGFETQGQRVAVMGREVHGLRESAFVAGFGNSVTWLSMGSRKAVPATELERLEALKINVADGHPRAIRCTPGEGVRVETHDGQTLEFDVLYPALGLTHASDLATALGAQAQEDGQLEVDEHYQTSVPGLYAAGDVAAGLNQINVAAGQAAIAATDVHNRL
ncbi:MAG: NAD(P)/FAD-dependent oxidoreductase [Pseudomonadota bacterium]